MADGLLKELAIALKLDSSDVQNGIQNVTNEIDGNLRAAFEAIAPFVEGLEEGLAEAADEAAHFGSAGSEAVQEVKGGAKEAADTIRHDLPQAARSAASQMDATFSSVGSKFKNFAMQIIGPITGAFAISGAVSTFMNGAMAAKEQAQEIGVASDELQLWHGAITRAGGNVQKFEMSLRRMAMSAKVAGDPLQALYKLAGDAEKMSRDAFTAKAKELGIDVATIGVLIQGRKALDEHLKRAKEIGIYEQRHIELAQKLKIGLWELNGSFDGLKNELLLMVLPAMEKALGVLTDIVLNLSNHAPMIAAAIGIVAAALSVRLLPQILKVTAAFLKWGPFIAVIAMLAIVIDDLYAYMHGGQSAFQGFWEQFGSGPELLEAFTNAWKNLKKIASDTLKLIIKLAKDLWKTLSEWGVIDDFKEMFTGLGHVIHGVLVGDTNEASEGAKQILHGMGKAIYDVFRNLGKIIWDGITGVCIRLKDWFINWCKETFTFQNIFGGLGELARDLASEDDESMQGVDVRGAVKSYDEKPKKTAAEVAKEFSSAWDSALDNVEDTVNKTADESEIILDKVWDDSSDHAVSAFGNAAAQIQTMFGNVANSISSQFAAIAASAQIMGASATMGIPAAGMRAAYAGGTTNNSNSSVSIGTMNVSTRATDANGVARGMNGALRRNPLVRSAQSGVNQKGGR